MANWDKITGSGNVSDLRGVGGALAGGSGIIALLVVVGLNFLGLNVPVSTVEGVLDQLQQNQSAQAPQAEQPAEFRGEDSYELFTKKVLGSTDDVWTKVFADNNLEYQKPKLVLFRDMVRSSCGVASSQVGPHYCPPDQTIYIDERFFDEIVKLGGSNSEVAQSYVIAHEVGHHVQNVLGTFDTSGGRLSASDSIQVELQADCYAGVWAYSMKNLGVFENESEINEAMSTAAAVGDDNIQKETTGRVDRESWTHGSSEQRVGAFSKGYREGRPSQCVDL